MKDPIVEQVRKIRERQAAECGNDLKHYFEELRKREVTCGHEVVSLERPRKTG